MSIIKRMEGDAVNLCGRTTLIQLAALYKYCFFSIVNDSAPMHMASYLNVPVLALFGATDPTRYGPWSEQSCFIRKNESCRRCVQPKTAFEHTCMKAISGDDVMRILKVNMFENSVDFLNDQ